MISRLLPPVATFILLVGIIYKMSKGTELDDLKRRIKLQETLDEERSAWQRVRFEHTKSAKGLVTDWNYRICLSGTKP